jgi:hypothetical protein
MVAIEHREGVATKIGRRRQELSAERQQQQQPLVGVREQSEPLGQQPPKKVASHQQATEEPRGHIGSHQAGSGRTIGQ